jgi:3-(3-hydroxy-phenyl)propionate hydroxylase
MLHEGEVEPEVISSEFIRKLLIPHGEEGTSLRRSCVYTFHARMADRWRDARVFLAGDAAHLSPPFAGQGMNSGIRDAHNLAWKLAAVLGGRLGPQLLDTYEQERRGHAWEMIQLALRMGKVMMPRSAWRAFSLQAAFRLLGIVPPVRSYFAEMKYKPKPRFHKGFLSGGPRDSRAEMIGKLLPQAEVRSASGVALLDDFLGDGFSLLCAPQTPANLFEKLPPDLFAQLQPKRVAVRAADDSATVPAGVERLTDDSGDFARWIRDVRPGILLVRPDRYVAAHIPANEIQAGIRDVNELIARTFR